MRVFPVPRPYGGVWAVRCSGCFPHRGRAVGAQWVGGWGLPAGWVGVGGSHRCGQERDGVGSALWSEGMAGLSEWEGASLRGLGNPGGGGCGHGPVGVGGRGLPHKLGPSLPQGVPCPRVISGPKPSFMRHTAAHSPLHPAEPHRRGSRPWRSQGAGGGGGSGPPPESAMRTACTGGHQAVHVRTSHRAGSSPASEQSPSRSPAHTPQTPVPAPAPVPGCLPSSEPWFRHEARPQTHTRPGPGPGLRPSPSPSPRAWRELRPHRSSPGPNLTFGRPGPGPSRRSSPRASLERGGGGYPPPNTPALILPQKAFPYPNTSPNHISNRQ